MSSLCTGFVILAPAIPLIDNATHTDHGAITCILAGRDKALCNRRPADVLIISMEHGERRWPVIGEMITCRWIEVGLFTGFMYGSDHYLVNCKIYTLL